MADDFYSNDTQIRWACKALIEGRTISTRDQTREVGGWRLGSIVCTLTNAYVWPIENLTIGTGKAAQYRLKPDADLSALRFPPSAMSLQMEDVDG